ncbi:venom serine carboxypeptidase [Glossina fuscipes fuscipes]
MKFSSFTIRIFAILLCVKQINCAEENTKARYRKSFINPYPRFKAHYDKGDPGEPLFLTPLIADPKWTKEMIRNISRVNHKDFEDIESYSGYLTVDPNYNSNMFFWYFPSEEDPAYSPVVLWLQGGPGASSLFGLFAENGPFEFNEDGELGKRNYTWSKTHNLIYIDNPVGTGFSFTDHEEGYARNEKTVGHNLHEAVQQLYEIFEWSGNSDFWIAGESYAGKYVPALAYHIHKVQNSIDTRTIIPLKGMAIGNGLSDPIHQLQYGDYLYQLGLIDEHGLIEFNEAEKKGKDCIATHKMDCAFEVFDNLLNGDMTNGSLFHNLTGFNYYYNYLRTKEDNRTHALGTFLQSSTVRKAIHVGNMTFHDIDTINKVEIHLKEDIMDTVAPWISELLNTYIVCIYNGQLDIIVAYPLTRNYLQHLKYKDANLYKIATREVWRMEDGEIAGYAKHAGNLIEIMVRNAGHMAPADQPKWMYFLIDHLTHYKKFN